MEPTGDHQVNDEPEIAIDADCKTVRTRNPMTCDSSAALNAERSGSSGVRGYVNLIPTTAASILIRE